MVSQHILICIEHFCVPLPHLFTTAKDGITAILIDEYGPHANALFNRIHCTGFVNGQG
ncbi:hypothetical protein SDC9_190771 [bioreactor metagenome]|uniref:Uncharacterized protein n=1 Tax=bioreactor metagenome TaxID=1076179 RepID=A0A645HXH8_9ZZZZ